MRYLTADEARAMAGVEDQTVTAVSVDVRVEQACKEIESAAKGKERTVLLRDHLWAYGGYHQTANWKMACEVLRSKGFEVEFFYEERQLVDMGTKIKW